MVACRTLHSRSDLAKAQRIVVKVGTSTVSRPDGSVSLGRIGHIVEQLSELHLAGRDVILVSSGAVGVGRGKLRKQQLFSRSVLSHMGGTGLEPPSMNACAAAGMSGVMGLYDQLFGQYDVLCAQVLVSPSDFGQEAKVTQLKNTLLWLLSHQTIPVLNENDAISSSRIVQAAAAGSSSSSKPTLTFSDNDGLAAVLAQLLEADVLLLLSDVEGIYRCMPAPGEKPDVIDVYSRATAITIGSKSTGGRGGMGAKIDAAMSAIEAGVGCVVIASGHATNTVTRVMSGEAGVGTLLVLDEDEAAAVAAAAAQPPGAPNGGPLGVRIGGDALAVQERLSPALNPLAGRPPQVLSPHSLAGPGFAPPPTGSALLQQQQQQPRQGSVAVGSGASAHAAAESVESSLATERAAAVRAASRQLQQLSGEERSELLRAIAAALLAAAPEIELANQLDVQAAEQAQMTPTLRARLHLPLKKLQTVVDGILALASKPNPLNRVRARTEIAAGLELVQETVAIGVLLVIFESRPDVLPQVSALALLTGNGLLLKGGREAVHTNRALHRIITQAVVDATSALSCPVDGAIVTLLEGRTEVDSLLKLHKEIDLVIPRGGAALVQHVMATSTIPVLGHADGICHVFVDKDCLVDKALRIVRDAKLDYPAACNAAETALLHSELARDGRAQALLEQLAAAGVSLVAGPRAALELGLPPAESLHVEYGDNTLCIELVDSVQEVVAHISKWGSGHTEVIVTENGETARAFLSQVDSACVFHNASSRFADGFRFGLGCEVGISTSRIHARGPVGLEGLLTTRWRLVSQADDGHCVGDFSSGVRAYTHESLPL